VGGNRELVVDGRTGFICQSHDARTLASRIEELIEDRELARSMGERGMERILREFGVEKMIRETERIYVALADKLLLTRRAVRSLCDS
jgi:glycosyltransferase involved in cell wall biosynthesis